MFFRTIFKSAIKNFVLNDLFPVVASESRNRVSSDLEKAALEAVLVVLKEQLDKRL